MSNTYPIAPSTKLGFFQKETTEGTFVDPTRSIHFSSDSIKNTPKFVEDESNIGKVFTTSLINVGKEIAGSVETLMHPDMVGDMFYFTLGESDTPTNPIEAIMLIWYTGTEKYIRLTRALATTILAEKSTDGTTWTADTSFGTAGTLTVGGTGLDTIAGISAAIEGYTGWESDYRGKSTSAHTKWATFTATTLKENDVSKGAHIAQFLATSTVAKTHYIYADNASSSSIPSFSAIQDKGIGSGLCYGLSGGKIQSMSIKLEPKNTISVSLNTKFKGIESGKTYGAGDVANTFPFVSNNCKIWVDRMKLNEEKDLTIDINNTMFMDEAVGVDSFNTQDRQKAKITVSGNVNFTYRASDRSTYELIDKMNSNTPVEIIIFIENLKYADVTNTVKHSVLIRIPAVMLTDTIPPVSGGNRLVMPINGEAVSDPFSKHIEVYVTNTQTTEY